MLAEDLKDIWSWNKTLIAAGKRQACIALVNKNTQNLLQKAITSKYKKTDKHTATNMNKEGVKHAREANIIDRLEIKGTGNSFIILKDHEKNF